MTESLLTVHYIIAFAQFKGTVHPKITIVPSFIHSQVVSNLYFVFRLFCESQSMMKAVLLTLHSMSSEAL